MINAKKHGKTTEQQRWDLFKEIRDTKGTVHAKTGTLKDRNGKDLTDLAEIKTCQEYTDKLYKKGLNDPDNHDSVVTHLEPDILEYKVMWALGRITTNKPSGGDWIQAELLKILKDDPVKKVLYQNVSKFGKLSSGHRTREGQVSSQSQRRAMPKNVQTTVQLCSFHMLARLCQNLSRQASAVQEPRTSKCTSWV